MQFNVLKALAIDISTVYSSVGDTSKFGFVSSDHHPGAVKSSPVTLTGSNIHSKWAQQTTLLGSRIQLAYPKQRPTANRDTFWIVGKEYPLDFSRLSREAESSS
jgi:hypothetical protein